MKEKYCVQCGQLRTGRTRAGLCRPCYQYVWRTGRMRPEHLRFPGVRRCAQCNYTTERSFRGLCHACYERTRRRTRKLRELLVKINIKSTFATGTFWRSEHLSIRLIADYWQPGVANQDDIKLGRINAN